MTRPIRDLFPDLKPIEREHAYQRKLEALAIEIQHQHGLPGEPMRLTIMGLPRLTEVMMKLIESFRVTHISELVRGPPPRLPLGLLPVLMEQVPEEALPSVLAALRAAARRMHDEDNSPPAHAMRFFERLQRRS